MQSARILCIRSVEVDQQLNSVSIQVLDGHWLISFSRFLLARQSEVVLSNYVNDYPGSSARELCKGPYSMNLWHRSRRVWQAALVSEKKSEVRSRWAVDVYYHTESEGQDHRRYLPDGVMAAGRGSQHLTGSFPPV
jgi:hypothetical protein